MADGLLMSLTGFFKQLRESQNPQARLTSLLKHHGQKPHLQGFDLSKALQDVLDDGSLTLDAFLAKHCRCEPTAAVVAVATTTSVTAQQHCPTPSLSTATALPEIDAFHKPEPKPAAVPLGAIRRTPNVFPVPGQPTPTASVSELTRQPPRFSPPSGDPCDTAAPRRPKASPSTATNGDALPRKGDDTQSQPPTRQRVPFIADDTDDMVAESTAPLETLRAPSFVVSDGGFDEAENLIAKRNAAADLIVKWTAGKQMSEVHDLLRSWGVPENMYKGRHRLDNVLVTGDCRNLVSICPELTEWNVPQHPSVDPQCYIVMRHFSNESYKYFSEACDKLERLKIHKAVCKLLRDAPPPKTCREGGASVAAPVDYLLVKTITGRDKKGPFYFDPMFQMLEVVIRYGTPTDEVGKRFPMDWDTSRITDQSGEVAKEIQHEFISSASSANTSGRTASALKGDVSTWVHDVFLQNDRPNKLVASKLKEHGIQTLQQLVDLSSEQLKEMSNISVGDRDFLDRQRQLWVSLENQANNGGCGGTDRGVDASPTMVAANLHKIRRFFFFHAGCDELLPLLDPRAVEKGLQAAARTYKNPAVLNLLYVQLLKPLTEVRTKMPRGLLLYGPPGTGKTHLIKEICAHCGLTLVEGILTAGELNKGIVGESEELISNIFNRCRLMPHLPCAVAIDEIDSAVPKRDDSGGNQHGADKVSVFLGCITGGTDVPNLILMGATNRREAIDEAVRRRLEVSIYVGFLDETSRRLMIQLKLLDVKIPESMLLPDSKTVRAITAASKMTARCNKDLPLDTIVDRQITEHCHSDFLTSVHCAMTRTKVAAWVQQWISKGTEYDDVELALGTLFATPGKFYEPVVDEMVRLTINFSGAALELLCAALFSEWTTYYRSPPSERSATHYKSNPWSFAPHKVVTSACGQYEALLDVLRRVSLTLDIKLGAQTVSEVLFSENQLVSTYRRESLVQHFPQCSGLMVVNPDEGLMLQLEVYNRMSQRLEMVPFELRPFCNECQQYCTAFCSAYKIGGKHPLHMWDARGRQFASEEPTRYDAHRLLKLRKEDRTVVQDPDVDVSETDILKELVNFVALRKLTRIIYKKMSTLIVDGATDEKKLLEELAVAVKQASAPGSHTMLVFDLDSIAGVQQNMSEGSLGSISYSLSNPKLFDFVVEKFVEFRRPLNPATKVAMGSECDPLGECWCCLLIRNPQVASMFKSKTGWHDSPAQQREADEERRLKEEHLCTECRKPFTEEKNQESFECTFHPGHRIHVQPTDSTGRTAWSVVWSEAEARVRKISFAATGNNSDANKGHAIVYSCCFGEMGSAGCRYAHHTTHPSAQGPKTICTSYKAYFSLSDQQSVQWVDDEGVPC